MFDPAASLMKSMGLVLPAESAGSVIPAMPGDSRETAENGGFAGLLATKIDAAAPELTTGAAPERSPQLIAEAASPPHAATAAIDVPANALPATGKMLPPALPVTAPVAAAPQAAAPAIALAMATPGQAGPAIPSPVAQVPAAPAALPLVAVVRAALLQPQGADEAASTLPPAASPEPQPVRSPFAMPAAPAKLRAAARGAEAAPAEMPEPADDQPESSQAEQPQDGQPQPSPVLTAAPAVSLTNAASVEVSPDEAVRTAPRARADAPLPAAVVTPQCEVAPEAPRTEAAQPLPQTQPQVPQATIRIAAAPASARLEREPAPVAAPAARDAEPAGEITPAAAPRTAQPFAMLSPAMPAQAPLTLSAMPASAVQAPTDFAQIVDRLVAAREAVAPAEVRVTLDHAQFGKVSVGFTPDASGMNVTLAAADPEFARAVEAAAPFAPSVTTETQSVPAPAASRGADLSSAFTGQQGQQAGRQAPQDSRPSGPQANPSARTTDSDEKPGKGRGVFA